MRLSNRLKERELIANEVGVSRHLAITHLNSPTVAENANAMVFSVIHCQGVPFDTQTDEMINEQHRHWHQALMALDDRFCLQVTLHRHKESIELSGEFIDDFANTLDQQYHAQFKDRALYVNDIYISLIYKGLSVGKAAKGVAWFRKVNEQAVKSAREARRQAQIKALLQARNQLVVSLGDFKPRVLGERDSQLGYSELLSFLSLFPNGGEALRLPAVQSIQSPAVNHRLNTMASPITDARDDQIKQRTVYPQGHVGQYLSRKQVLFGEGIQFQGATTTDVRFGAMLSIKRYGHQTHPLMFDPLLSLSGESISTHTFAIAPKDWVQKTIGRHAIKLHNTNDPAVTQIAALADAQDQLASDVLVMGYHHHTIMVLADSLVSLDHQCQHTIKQYQQADVVVVRETLGQEAAFWAQIPTNNQYIARGSLITSHNFTDFCPLHNCATGFKDQNHLGSAMTLIETPAKTPYFLNLHTQGSKDNPAPGHTTIIGGNNSGKTTMMGFFAAQLSRYGGRSVFFDRDRGLDIYVRARGGHYAILSPDHPDSVKLNPFQLPDTPANRQCCRDWLSLCLLREDETELDDNLLRDVAHCVDYAYEQLDPKHRQLSHVVKLLPIDFPRWPRLRRWLRGDDQHPDGEYAYLFDNPTDALSQHSIMGFDMTHFLDKEPQTVLTALTMYLLHPIEHWLDGKLMSIFLEEGWQYLQNTYWQ